METIKHNFISEKDFKSEIVEINKFQDDLANFLYDECSKKYSHIYWDKPIVSEDKTSLYFGVKNLNHTYKIKISEID